MKETMIFQCEAVKTHLDRWVLTKVKNDALLFNLYQYFDNDYLDENLNLNELNKIKDEYECKCIEFDLVGTNNNKIIRNIKYKRNKCGQTPIYQHLLT